jgi:hypothetical protein
MLRAMAKTTRTTKGKKALPAALVKRAKAEVTAKHSRLATRAHGLLDLISRRKSEISEAFYDIGEALAELSHPDMISALGRKTFTDVCKKDCGLSATLAEGLIRVVTTMTRDEALAAGGQTKAIALATLAQATPDLDTPAGLGKKRGFALPNGKKVDLAKASTREIEHAAVAVRRAAAAKSGKKARGRTTTEDERALAALLEKKLHALGLHGARVTAVATKPGQGGDLRFEHIPCAKVDLLKKAIGA